MGLFSFFSELFSDSPKAQPTAPEPSAPSIADIDPFYGSDRFVNGTENLGQYMEYLQLDKAGELETIRNPIDMQPIETTSASNIHGIDLFGESRDSDRFWNQHGLSKSDYTELASHIPEVQSRLNSGESLQSVMHDPKVGACANCYFNHVTSIVLYHSISKSIYHDLR